MGKKKSGEVASKLVCQDTGGKQYREHSWLQWGDDPRYKRCSRCGTISAEGISSEAKYPRVKQPERPIRHHHQFTVSCFDRRYEHCSCGAMRKCGAGVFGGAA